MFLVSQVWGSGCLGDRTGYLTKCVLPLPKPDRKASWPTPADTETGLAPRTTLGIKLNELQANPAGQSCICGTGPHCRCRAQRTAVAAAGALVGAPANELMDRGGGLWVFVPSATEGLRDLRPMLASLHRSVYQSDARLRLELESRVQTRGALFAVRFFGDLTERSGPDAVINAAIDDVENVRKSLKAKVSSGAQEVLGSLAVSYVDRARGEVVSMPSRHLHGLDYLDAEVDQWQKDKIDPAMAKLHTLPKLTPPAVTLNLAYARAAVMKPLPQGFMGPDKKQMEEAYLSYLTELEKFYNEHNKTRPTEDHVKAVMIPTIARRYQLDLWVKADDPNKPNFDLDTLAKIQAAITADLTVFSECQTKATFWQLCQQQFVFAHPEAGTMKPATPHFVHGRLERLTAHANANGKMSRAVLTAQDKFWQPFLKNAARTVMDDNAQVVAVCVQSQA
ncbi:hypothetical protein HDU88_003105 [Geranomyces variabilis]|nr:hypothetical protein HDU88_003105 [Geranomyces variabilis]